ncbi:MAG: ferritin-like domain-containing protein [Desulfococcaceae bacterium]
MTERQAVEILKNAILLETRGQAFYRNVAEQTDHPGVREFFELMAQEEERHIEMLRKQYRSFSETGRFVAGEYGHGAVPDMASDILNRELREKISGAGYEAAAISAAISMEERAVKLYGERAEQTGNPEEKALYQWLADWERDHLNALLDMDRELTEKLWSDQGFWPF